MSVAARLRSIPTACANRGIPARDRIRGGEPTVWGRRPAQPLGQDPGSGHCSTGCTASIPPPWMRAGRGPVPARQAAGPVARLSRRLGRVRGAPLLAGGPSTLPAGALFVSDAASTAVAAIARQATPTGATHDPGPHDSRRLPSRECRGTPPPRAPSGCPMCAARAAAVGHEHAPTPCLTTRTPPARTKRRERHVRLFDQHPAVWARRRSRPTTARLPVPACVGQPVLLSVVDAVLDVGDTTLVNSPAAATWPSSPPRWRVAAEPRTASGRIADDPHLRRRGGRRSNGRSILVGLCAVALQPRDTTTAGSSSATRASSVDRCLTPQHEISCRRACAASELRVLGPESRFRAGAVVGYRCAHDVVRAPPSSLPRRGLDRPPRRGASSSAGRHPDASEETSP